MVMSVLDPIYQNCFFPAIVIYVHNYFFFSIQILKDLSPTAGEEQNVIDGDSLLFCHSSSNNIYPIDWCSKNRLKLTVPKGFF